MITQTKFFIPDFIEIQRNSFKYLLEKGLIQEFLLRNPISNSYLEIFFYPEYYQLSAPQWTKREAILKGKSYSSKLYIPVQFIDKKNKKMLLKWMLIGELPIMTKRGNFILNGAPRVIVNQLIRSPGIYYQEKNISFYAAQTDSKPLVTFKRYYADCICLRGIWLRIEIDKHKHIWAQFKKYPKIPLLWFLYAMGLSQTMIFKSIVYPIRLLANFENDESLRVLLKRPLEIQSNKENFKYINTPREAWQEIAKLLKIQRDPPLRSDIPTAMRPNTSSMVNKINTVQESYLSPAATLFPYGEKTFRWRSPPPERGVNKRSGKGSVAVDVSPYRESLRGRDKPSSRKLVTDSDPLWGPAATQPTFINKRRDAAHQVKESILCQSFVNHAKMERDNNLTNGYFVSTQMYSLGQLPTNTTIKVDLQNSLKTSIKQNSRGTTTERIVNSKLRPIFTPEEFGRKWIYNTFMNSRKYDLGRQGRDSLNRKLGLTISPLQTTLTPQDVLYATDYLLKVEKGLRKIDDIDHLMNRRIRTSGELIQMQIGIGLDELEKTIRKKLENEVTFYDSKETFSFSKLTSQDSPATTLFPYGEKTFPFMNKSRLRSSRRWRSPPPERGLNKRTEYSEIFTATDLSSANLGGTKTAPIREWPRPSTGSSKATAGTLKDIKANKGEKVGGRGATPPPIGGVSRSRTSFASTKHEEGVKIGETSSPYGDRGTTEASPRKLNSFAAFSSPPRGEGSKKRFEVFNKELDLEKLSNNLISSKKLNDSLREFFGTNPLSQFMDQINPLAEITHKRRLSSMGPGGVGRENAPMAIRNIHPTHYGRICPIETPEGKNTGLVNSLTTCARVRPNGFIETPFYKVYKGQVQQNLGIFYLNTEEEEQIKAAPADLTISNVGFLPRSRVPIRFATEFTKIERTEVQFIGVAPIQMISLATALIPFLEHDDANRALMGSNMQRQAVPIIRPERPIVGTGLEGRAASDSGHVIQARNSGFVSYVSADKIVIYAVVEE